MVVQSVSPSGETSRMCFTDLPRKYEHKLSCVLSPRQLEWHTDVIARAATGGDDNHPFALISRLMRVYQHPSLVPSYEPIEPDDALATCPKLALLIEQLAAVRQLGEKALIFTRSLDMQQLLALACQSRFSVHAEIINGASGRGGMTQSGLSTRQGILTGSVRVLVLVVLILSPDVAGIGLTLVEANHVFHYGRSWNPAKEAQATDRAFRIGQERDVHVYRSSLPIPKENLSVSTRSSMPSSSDGGHWLLIFSPRCPRRSCRTRKGIVR